MDREKVRAILEAVARGSLDPAGALARLRDLPVEDLRFARPTTADQLRRDGRSRHPLEEMPSVHSVGLE